MNHWLWYGWEWVEDLQYTFENSFRRGSTFPEIISASGGGLGIGVEVDTHMSS